MTSPPLPALAAFQFPFLTSTFSILPSLGSSLAARRHAIHAPNLWSCVCFSPRSTPSSPSQCLPMYKKIRFLSGMRLISLGHAHTPGTFSSFSDFAAVVILPWHTPSSNYAIYLSNLLITSFPMWVEAPEGQTLCLVFFCSPSIVR